MIKRLDLIPSNSGEEETLRQIISQIDVLCEDIAELKMARNDLDVDLRQAKVLFYDTLGDLYIQKMQKDLEYRMLQARIRLILEGKLSDEEIDQALARKFHKEREELSRLTGERDTVFEERVAVEKLAQVDADLKQVLRRQYLTLAKKLHPDRFPDPKDRAQAEEDMKRLNEYYQNHDLQAMLDLQNNLGIGVLANLTETLADKIRQGEVLLAQLRQTRVRLVDELEALRSSQLYQLKLQIDEGKKAGRNVVDQLTEQLREEIAKLSVQVARLRRRLGGLG